MLFEIKFVEIQNTLPLLHFFQFSHSPISASGSKNPNIDQGRKEKKNVTKTVSNRRNFSNSLFMQFIQ